MYRHALCIVGLILVVACRHDTGRSVPVIDLLRELDRAEKRPPHGFALAAHAAADRVRPAIVVPVPSRLTIPLRLPEHGMLHASVTLEGPEPSAAVRFRVGISDDRIYEGLGEILVRGDQRGWMDLRADLSPYAGFKWSLFYRPNRIVWRLVLATDAVAGGPARGVWGTPEIVADEASAKRFAATRDRNNR
jgi:hypothetical protein